MGVTPPSHPALTQQKKAASHFTSQIQPALVVFIRKHQGHFQNPTIAGRKEFKSELIIRQLQTEIIIYKNCTLKPQ